MYYAPILIVTLDRSDCLSKCLNSLANNSWADKTDVYISVDYPPSKKYEDGYNKVLELLNSPVSGFNSVTVYYQKSNLGPYHNIKWLIDQVRTKYDRYILMEDDTYTAPGLIEFFDKGLVLFEDDADVIAINASDYVWCGNGYTPPVREVFNDEQNIEKRQLIFHASAHWIKKTDILYNFLESGAFLEIASDFKLMRKLYNKSKTFFYQYIIRAVLRRDLLPWYKDNLVMIDMVWDIYMLLNDKYVIAPKVNLMRDLGVTGNGINYTNAFENQSQLLERKMDLDFGFNYRYNAAVEVSNVEIQLHDSNLEISQLSRIKAFVQFMIHILKEKLR